VSQWKHAIGTLWENLTQRKAMERLLGELIADGEEKHRLTVPWLFERFHRVADLAGFTRNSLDVRTILKDGEPHYTTESLHELV
jgi:hypothetical protein